MSKTLDYLKQARICVIIPTYNNAGTIIEVLKRIRSYAADVIVVNDGSTDDTAKKIAEARRRLFFSAKRPGKGHGH